MKVIILGVGNSGTKLIGELVWDLLRKQGFQDYHYEPLYWSGLTGERGLVLNQKAIIEHRTFPLIPEKSQNSWPWMNNFIDNLNGLAKFIRAGSRVKTFINRTDVKYIWITRELYSYLGSMQQNFPRCLPDKGWHHRPGGYDDGERLQKIYAKFELKTYEKFRIELEAAWWHLHNNQIYRFRKKDNLFHVRYEDLCKKPSAVMADVSKYLGLVNSSGDWENKVSSIVNRNVKLSYRNIKVIESITGKLNDKINHDLRS